MKRATSDKLLKLAEARIRRGVRGEELPFYTLLHDGEHYRVAMLDEVEAIADPNSFLGRLLRGYCSAIALPYLSNN